MAVDQQPVVAVEVDGVSWTVVESLAGHAPESVAAAAEETANGILVTFGDGVHGRRPPAGAKVRVTYGRGGGRPLEVRLARSAAREAAEAATWTVVRSDGGGIEFTVPAAEPGRIREPWPRLAWAAFFARAVLGLIFFMAGCYKVFALGAVAHVERWFLPYADTFLPIWSLWAVGLAIPFVELIAGALVLAGWRARPALLALGCVLVVVTFGHLLKEPLYPFHQHVVPRLALVLFLLALPVEADRLSVDGWRRRRRAVSM